jgi:predicted ATPase
VHGPWVRRGRELDAVREGLAALADRRGSAMVLVGEVGAGKSRLVRELAEVAARRHLSAWVARCTAFGEDPTMAPVRELVFAVLGVASDAPADDLRSQLPRLSQLGLTAREIAALAAITGVGELRPGQRTDAWSALRHMIAGLAEDRPVIVAFEDLHHLDARSRDRLRGVVSSLADRPVMFLLTHRLPLPDDLRDIGPTVTLGPFQPSDQRRLLAYLLDAQEVHEDLWALVDRTCEGNPLYIEEMVKYLQREHRVDVHNGEARLANTLKVSDLPSSLTAFVAARIDALDAASKGTLQLAALLGMEFSAQLLADAAGVDDATPLIHDLAGHNLVVRDEGDHDRWRITSELVREAALRGILRIQRADYHRLIASAIETRYADGLDAWMETLAHHCAAGGRLIDAARYAHRLGAALEQAHQLGRARSIYARALQWVRRVPDADSWEAKVQGEATIALRLGSV